MVGPRLFELIGLLRHNPNSFAEEIGVAATVIYNITGRRKSNPSFEVLGKIKSAFPTVNMNWLISGEGLPIIDESAKPVDPEIKMQIADLTNRMQQFEELINFQDKHVSVLQNKIDALKEHIEKD